MMSYKVGFIVGSLAAASINRKLATALVRLAPAELKLTEIPIRDLPLYSYDYDANFPEVARDFKKSVESSDALLFVTPEYNRSVPGGLKNAIEWGSRPKAANVFADKPSAVIGTSPGKIGTAVAQRALHSVLNAVGSPQMNTPEAYIQFTKDLIDDAGNVSDDTVKQFLGRFMKAFHAFLVKTA